MTSLVHDRLQGDGGRGGSPSAAARRRWLGRLAGPIVVVLVFGIWELYSRLRETPSYILPRPSAIAEAAWDDRSALLSELGQTVLEAIGGFSMAAFVAIVLAVAVQGSRTFELTVLPWIMVLQAVPVVAITPVIALIIGRNAFTAMVIAAIIALFPILINTVRGLASATDESVELMHVLGASRWATFRHLRLPGALPYTFAGLRVAASVVVPGAMVAEWITADSGLGFYILDQSVAYQTQLVWAGILVATLTGVMFFTVVTWIERRIVPWAEAPVVVGA